MKKSFFSKILVLIFFLGGLSVNAQIRVKTNKSSNKVVKTNRSNSYNKGAVRVKNNKTPNRVVRNNRSNYYNNRGVVRGKTNANRVVVTKPNRPKRIITRPNYNRPGYFWQEGYWQWNDFYGRYTWQHARWIKVKRNHYWVPGYWEISAAGFFWVAGYWELEY